MGRVPLIRGEIRWYTFRLPANAAPVTRTIRGSATEILLTEDDGMPAPCAVTFDHLSLGQRDRFGSVLCSLSGERWPEVRKPLLIACGFEQELD